MFPFDLFKKKKSVKYILKAKGPEMSYSDMLLVYSVLNYEIGKLVSASIAVNLCPQVQKNHNEIHLSLKIFTKGEIPNDTLEIIKTKVEDLEKFSEISGFEKVEE